MSGVPPGLTVDLVLFSIFKTIWMECTHTKVVDDTELGSEVDGPEGRATIQRQVRRGPTKTARGLQG